MRQEFTKPVKVEIVKRATDEKRVTRCEKCHAICRKFDIHHVEQDAMKLAEIKKARKLTADDGMLLCEPCHDEITAEQAPILAEAKGREATHLGVRTVPVRKIESGPMPKSEKAAKRQPKEPLPPRAMFRNLRPGETGD